MLLELCMRRTYGKDPLYGLLLTFGAALVIEELIRAGLGLEREAAAAARGDLRRRSCWATSSTRKYRFFACGFAVAG